MSDKQPEMEKSLKYMIWWIVGVFAFLVMVIFLWLLTAGADESKRKPRKDD